MARRLCPLTRRARRYARGSAAAAAPSRWACSPPKTRCCAFDKEASVRPREGLDVSRPQRAGRPSAAEAARPGALAARIRRAGRASAARAALPGERARPARRRRARAGAPPAARRRGDGRLMTAPTTATRSRSAASGAISVAPTRLSSATSRCSRTASHVRAVAARRAVRAVLRRVGSGRAHRPGGARSPLAAGSRRAGSARAHPPPAGRRRRGRRCARTTPTFARAGKGSRPSRPRRAGARRAEPRGPGLDAGRPRRSTSSARTASTTRAARSAAVRSWQRSPASWRPGRLWECSHVGGDRFAGNVVALPSGLYLGRVEPDEASAVVELIDSGRVPVHYLRGRSCFSPPVQAAQHFARTDRWARRARRDRRPAPDARGRQLRVTGRTPGRVTLATDRRPVGITVRRATSAEPAQLTCHSTDEKLYPTFELVRFERLTGESRAQAAGSTLTSTPSPANESIPAMAPRSANGSS